MKGLQPLPLETVLSSKISGKVWDCLVLEKLRKNDLRQSFPPKQAGWTDGKKSSQGTGMAV